MQIPLMDFFENRNYPKFLFVLFLLIWLAVAIDPVSRVGWLMENLIIFALAPFIIWSYKKMNISNISYTMVFIFLVLHVVGAYFSYSVPGLIYEDRNYYDRLVHFSFGLLIVYPLRELFTNIAKTKGFWSYYIPVDLILSFSAIYEILEWLAALIVSPQTAATFVGMQGDEFDAIKDMSLALIGALITMSTAYLTRKR